MKMRAAVLFLFGVAAVSAFPSNDGSYRIVGGTETTIEQYPFAVVLLSTADGTIFRLSCGGTVLNNRAILSAAHCFITLSQAWRWRVRMGTTSSITGGSVFSINQIIRHPNFNQRTVDMDFAILHLAGTIPFDGSIPAPAPASIAGTNYNVADDQEVWAIGWGQICQQQTCQISTILRHVQVWSVNRAICRERYAELRYTVTENMLCSGWLDVGGRDQCQGDSGGPLLHNGVVVGVTSWGYGCGLARWPGVSALVSVATEWIVANA